MALAVDPSGHVVEYALPRIKPGWRWYVAPAPAPVVEVAPAPAPVVVEAPAAATPASAPAEEARAAPPRIYRRAARKVKVEAPADPVGDGWPDADEDKDPA